ncbi:MAG: 2-aminoethylphosphonate--pyruvate transaminase [Hyphomicrobiales bacterium]|jgi:2-aminoethylphosphonate-pyruvate transaminase|nr:2-aminoethylphosphonate--pyruvate transaminase [Hyphomicrobiales bacterium]
MTIQFRGPAGQETTPYLLTPGPLTTTPAVKEAMLRDWGSWDADLRAVVASIRSDLLDIADAAQGFECVLLQGSGSYGVEAALGSFAPKNKKTLMLTNGAYGERAIKALSYMNRDFISYETDELEAPSAEEVAALLKSNPDIGAVFLVQCETTSGIVNPIEDIAAVAQKAGCIVILDAMSSFGAMDLSMKRMGIDVLISSANKCIEGVPGFTYILARRDLLEASQGASHSLSLDLYEQWAYMQKSGQFRYTPPTHTLVAFAKALEQHKAEGGAPGRLARYKKTAKALRDGMRRIGLTPLLGDNETGPIIQTFATPRDPNFDFTRFYEGLKQRGFIIYPGKLTKKPSFRVGNMGALDHEVMEMLVDATEATLKAMNIKDLTPAE